MGENGRIFDIYDNFLTTLNFMMKIGINSSIKERSK